MAIRIKQYCWICDREIGDVDKHIGKYHKYIKDEKHNDGNNLCQLCDVMVANLYRHYFSDLHRYNVKIDAVYIKPDLDGFIRHMERYNTKQTVSAIRTKDGEETHPFWITAKKELSEEDYTKLKEYINGSKAETDTAGIINL